MDLLTLIDPLIPYKHQGEQVGDNIHISSIEMDSRKVTPGALFVCLKGYQVDGHQFAHQAVQNGAVAILAQEFLDVGVPVILVPDSRRALAVIADRFYHHPTHSLRLIGVTGTNGKTTVTYLIEKILELRDEKAGRIGTINMKIGDQVVPIKNTTPESLDLQQAFSKMVESGSKYAIIEASSHAIHMGRIRGCNFRTVVFTNLTQDHLDYHGTMENYKQAKGLIFSQLGNRYDQEDMKYAILNADDDAHIDYKQITPAQVITYGIDNQQADIRAKKIQITSQGTTFTVECFKGQEEFRIQMLGKFNVYNVLGAIGAGLVEGLTLSEMKSKLEKVTGVRGRVEPVDAGQDFSVIVDYAHTPDSLENVLMTINEFAPGDIYCVVGCGGDRDRTKRPKMANIAVNNSDNAIFTSDNPRSEKPEAILQDMIEGLNQQKIPHTKYTSIVNRKEAIYWAIKQAKKGDIVLIAGKGHETYQEINGRVEEFDDRQVALEAISEKYKGKL